MVTIKKLVTTNSVTITATVGDLALYYGDPLVAKSITFSIVVPDGMQVYSATPNYLDAPFAGYSYYASGQKIGTLRAFTMQVTPIDVNFSYLSMRENIPSFNITWPNGQIDSQSAIVSSTFVPHNPSDTAIDQVGVGDFEDRALLLVSPGIYASSLQSLTVPLEFLAQSGFWNQFGNNSQQRLFYADGTTKVYENGTWSSPNDGPWL